ncbi:ROK family protein [uncultured Clostridium sp.]|uniref:ROK family protein n=1 Tax=uncultured Clostridium sp. TaxID=59620 RepID=UPI002613110F|nr:ROK family protein [uncultured Clostridium sp.]
MIACIDIGGTSIKIGVLDKEGNIKFKSSLNVYQEWDRFIQELITGIEELKEKFNIEGIGISSPGAVDTKAGIVGGMSAIPCIHGPNFKEILSERFNLPVSIENDANCAALAENFNGSGKNIDSMLFVVCGTGIGGAILKNGKVHHGENLHGGEFGYMLMEEENGEFKNFSEVASTMSFVRKIRKQYNDQSWDGKKVFKEAEEGNEKCIEVIDKFYLNLAKGIFNLQYIYDPKLILLGGAISEREDFIERINEKLDYILEKVQIAKVKPIVKACTHKGDANLIGALANFLNEYN